LNNCIIVDKYVLIDLQNKDTHKQWQHIPKERKKKKMEFDENVDVGDNFSELFKYEMMSVKDHFARNLGTTNPPAEGITETSVTTEFSIFFFEF
jgi:hypothetical protein